MKNGMNRKLHRRGLAATALLLAFACAFVFAQPVCAESKKGGDGWTVQFDGDEMTSTFHTDEIADAVYALQPGDDVTFSLEIENTSSVTTDWYMTNEVLQSLEDTQAVADNGGYSYILTYDGTDGEEVLYSSDSVGGEKDNAAGEGLNEATDSLEDFFFLDRLDPGATGSVSLYVSLDGESQGNVYQDTLADLQMNFAVELVTDTTVKPKSKLPEEYEFLSTDSPTIITTTKTKQSTVATIVSNVVTVFSTVAAKTGDMWKWGSIALLIAGLLTGAFAIFGGRKKKDPDGKGKKAGKSLLMLFAVLLAGVFVTKAAPVYAAANYTYTVTISAGKQGTFASTDAITVDNAATGSDYEITNDGKLVRITGLCTGDVVSCNAQASVTLADDSKYYVKGIRQSGRDNNTVAASAFTVDGDKNYVVAYGIPGELTQYTVSYVDEDGAALADSQMYYGNVGDEPVIAYLYIDGYVPATYNASRALVSDPSDNQFIFVYMRATSEVTTQEPEVIYETVVTTVEPSSSPAQTPIVVETTTEEVTATTIPGETIVVETADPDSLTDDEDADDGSDSDADTGADEAAGESGDEDKTIFDRIADTVVPLANFVKEVVANMAANGTLVPAIIGLIALVARLSQRIVFLKRRKKKDDETPEAANAQGGGETPVDTIAQEKQKTPTDANAPEASADSGETDEK